MKKGTGTFLATTLLAILTACIPMKGDFGRHRLAFVTNEKDNNLMVVDLEKEQIIKTIPTGKVPHALVFTPAGKGYVNNRGQHSLTVINGATLTAIKEIPLPATSMQLALSPDGRTLAVGYKDALKITLIDTNTDAVLATVDIGKDRPGKRPIRIKHPFWSADGRFVYAGDCLNKTLVKIDAAKQAVSAVIPIEATTHHLATAPDGTIYVAQGADGNGRLAVTVLDPRTDRIIKTITIPMAPGEKAKGHHGVFSPDGRYFYFCNEGGRTLAVISTRSRQVLKTLQVGQGAGHTYFSRDGGRAFVVCHHDNVITVIDTAAQEIVKTIRTGDGKKEGHSGYLGEDGSFYMLNAADGRIIHIDGESLTVKSTIKVGAKPMIMVVR